ncbi:MAG: DUF2182 domain-containing protein [Alphaproteobacteria bacterium]|nr:DUF2182 domain-containing protein [Alphaproteobacteria bacterium]
MEGGALEAVLRRDRQMVSAALLLLTLLALGYILWLAGRMAMPTPGAMPDMPGMDMPGMDMPMGAAVQPVLKAWTAGEFLLTFVMWSVMMVAMMLPSAAPMILLYARVGRMAQAAQKPFAATGWFAGGYLLAWTLFSLLATAAQGILTGLALLTPMMASASDAMGGVILIAAGLYQWTPWKDRCLAHCRAPLAFIQRHGGFRPRPSAALGLGLRHGFYCVGCCWALMALLFVGGIMNIAWIAGLAVLVLLEKLLKHGRLIARGAGLAAIAAGLILLAPAA